MRFFVAGVTVNLKLDEKIRAFGGRRLFTFFHHHDDGMGTEELRWWNTHAVEGTYPSKMHVLDSGAYSAWIKNRSIDMDAYVSFIESCHPDLFGVVANIDVIPGAWGHVPTQSEIDKSAAAGWENYHALQRRLAPRGIKPMHIFHQGENFKWLTRLMDEMEYFGISPGNDRRTSQKQAWLDECMRYLTDKTGKPIRKFHGFGVAAFSLVTRYPWYSVDATTWRQLAMYGMVLYPSPHRMRDLTRIAVSVKSPQRHETNSRHVNQLNTKERALFAAHVGKYGFTIEQLSESLADRDMCNLSIFLDWFKAWTPPRFDHGVVQPMFDLGL